MDHTSSFDIQPAGSRWRAALDRYAVALFCTLTVVLTFAVMLLPLPVLAGPALVVFIPILVAGTLIALTTGVRQVPRQLFGREIWGISLKWVGISLGVGVLLRAAVSLLALALGYTFRPDPVTPFLLITFLFAAAEEIGWRGFALPRLLRTRSPLPAALLLGVPWAFLHLSLLLPGRLLAGVPAGAVLLTMLSMSVLTTWAYLGSGGSVTAATLLHGAQNALVILNAGVPVGAVNWMMAAVYLAAALLVILATRGRLGAKPQAF